MTVPTNAAPAAAPSHLDGDGHGHGHGPGHGHDHDHGHSHQPAPQRWPASLLMAGVPARLGTVLLLLAALWLAVAWALGEPA